MSEITTDQLVAEYVERLAPVPWMPWPELSRRELRARQVAASSALFLARCECRLRLDDPLMVELVQLETAYVAHPFTPKQVA